MAILSDEFYYQPIRIDTINTRVYADLLAKEGDANGRGLLVTLTENGLVKNTTGIALNLKWEHTSVGNQGLDNFEAVDPSKGLYKITYPTEMLNRGKVRAFIQIIDSGKLAGTRNIEITVDRGVGDDTAIASSNSFSALAQALIDVNNLESTYAPELNSLKTQLEQAATKDELSQVATPLAVSLAAQMTDITRVYVYTGSEGGYTAGNWYYHNGTAFVSGGVYQSTGIADGSIVSSKLNQEYDFRGTLIGGDANTCINSGIYFLTATSLNIPAETSIMLYVQRYGSRFVQVARRFDNPTISWVRGGDVTNIANLIFKTDIVTSGITTDLIANKAVTKDKIADKTIEAAQLSSGYNYRGFYFGDTVSANDLLEDGRYYLASTVLNLPTRNYFGSETFAVIMEVEKYNTRTVQKARPINYPDEIYYRYTESNFVGVPWKLMQRVFKPLYGKKIILMGDSLIDKGKQHLTIWDKTGADVDKIGIGGTTMSNHGNSADYSKLSFYALAQAIKTGIFTEQETAVANILTASGGLTDLSAWLTKFKAIDWTTINYIQIRYGTNDHAMDNLIGAVDRTNVDTSNYIGAFNKGVQDILTAYPHIRIFVATPLWRYSVNIGTGGDSDTTPNTNGDYLTDFVDALNTAAGFNHMPFYDYYRHSGINSVTDAYYLSDQTHLTDAGSLLIGEIDSNFLTSC